MLNILIMLKFVSKPLRAPARVLEDLQPRVEVHEHVVGGMDVRVVGALLQRAVLEQPLALFHQRAQELLFAVRHLQQPCCLLQHSAVVGQQLLCLEVVLVTVACGGVGLALQPLQLHA